MDMEANVFERLEIFINQLFSDKGLDLNDNEKKTQLIGMLDKWVDFAILNALTAKKVDSLFKELPEGISSTRIKEIMFGDGTRFSGDVIKVMSEFRNYILEDKDVEEFKKFENGLTIGNANKLLDLFYSSNDGKQVLVDIKHKTIPYGLLDRKKISKPETINTDLKENIYDSQDKNEQERDNEFDFEQYREEIDKYFNY